MRQCLNRIVDVPEQHSLVEQADPQVSEASQCDSDLIIQFVGVIDVQYHDLGQPALAQPAEQFSIQPRGRNDGLARMAAKAAQVRHGLQGLGEPGQLLDGKG